MHKGTYRGLVRVSTRVTPVIGSALVSCLVACSLSSSLNQIASHQRIREYSLSLINAAFFVHSPHSCLLVERAERYVSNMLKAESTYDN